MTANHTSGSLARLDARLLLVGAIAYVIAVVLVPVGSWSLFAALALLLAVLVVASRVAMKPLLTRWLAFLPLVGFLAIVIAPGLPARREHGFLAVFLTILARNGLALLTMLLLSAVVPWPRLLTAMRRLGCPAILVGTLRFMERYTHVLGDELGRMTTALRARSFRRRGNLSWSLMTSLIGMLLLRSIERSERVHSAMLARGWDGTQRSLED
jgi:cobalt/nickel transport system permease protein